MPGAARARAGPGPWWIRPSARRASGGRAGNPTKNALGEPDRTAADPAAVILADLGGRAVRPFSRSIHSSKNLASSAAAAGRRMSAYTGLVCAKRTVGPAAPKQRAATHPLRVKERSP